MKPYKTNPFKVPKLYFEKLEALLLQETKTKLDIPFKVPQDYFESLENHIFQKTVGITKVESNTSFYAIAAAFIVLFASFFWIQYNNTDTLTDEALNWVLLEEMNAYELANYVETSDPLYFLESSNVIDIDFLDYSFDFNETNTYENSID